MSKKKSRNRRRWISDDSQSPFMEFDDEELDLQEVVRHAYDEEPFPEEDEAFNEARFEFDLDRWRDDLTERASKRERMRQRDLKNGILRIDSLPPLGDSLDDYEL